ncbi:MAG: hypothetical protein RML95_06890 [Anaerolineae bacterium]|nr:hypothetical protein [Anaerolineae bacterium]MDW8299047.1 hypothetical protein [Anaerolineae bacterium]
MRTERPPYILIALLLGSGGYLLLRNFRLLPEVDLAPYAPLILVLLGVQLLLRGDLGISWAAQTFGITRGTVRAASLEAYSGELDVKLRALRREGRLIAGSYTARSRPDLTVRGETARLTMQRGRTWLFSIADWEVGLARDLPWNVLLSSFLGEIEADLRGIPINRAELGTGFGDIRLVLPELVGQGVRAFSTFGNVAIAVPEGCAALVRLRRRTFSRLQVDERFFMRLADDLYATLNHTEAARVTYAEVGSTFGTVRLVSIQTGQV